MPINRECVGLRTGRCMRPVKFTTTMYLGNQRKQMFTQTKKYTDKAYNNVQMAEKKPNRLQ